MTKIIILIGDGPESGDELEMYVYKDEPAIYKTVHPRNIYKTAYPTDPMPFDRWKAKYFFNHNQ